MYVCNPFEDWHSSEIYKCTLSTSQRTFAVSITRSSPLMLFRKIIVAWENRGFLNNTVGSRCSYLCTLDGYVTHHFAFFWPGSVLRFMQPVLRLLPEKYILRIPIFSEVHIIRTFPRVWYRGADTFLARPGRKQANVSVIMAWISFGALPCRKRNLMTALISILLKSCSSLTCFQACFPSRSG